MNTRTLSPRRGFTLIELLLATSLMTVIIMLVVNVLGTVMTSWSRANSTLEQNSQSGLILDSIGRDLSSGVIRMDGTPWLRHSRTQVDGREYSTLVFLSAPSDRGRTTTGSTPKAGESLPLISGNVGTVAYAVDNINPVKPSSSQNTVNSIFRYLVSPEKTFAGAITNFSSTTWETVREGVAQRDEANAKSLIGSNIYGFDVSYSYRNSSGTITTVKSKDAASFQFPTTKDGRVIFTPEFFEITLTILSENGAQRLQALKEGLTTEDEKTIIAQESRQFSRRYFMPAQGLNLSVTTK